MDILELIDRIMQWVPVIVTLIVAAGGIITALSVRGAKKTEAEKIREETEKIREETEKIRAENDRLEQEMRQEGLRSEKDLATRIRELESKDAECLRRMTSMQLQIDRMEARHRVEIDQERKRHKERERLSQATQQALENELSELRVKVEFLQDKREKDREEYEAIIKKLTREKDALEVKLNALENRVDNNGKHTGAT